jgi:hypothetical protein
MYWVCGGFSGNRIENRNGLFGKDPIGGGGGRDAADRPQVRLVAGFVR